MSKRPFHKFFHDFFSWQHVAIWVVLIILAGVGVVWGATRYNYFKALGNNIEPVKIPADQYFGSLYPCKVVNNGSVATYFIPTKTVTEWQAFTGHLPSGVTLSTCVTCGSGYLDNDKDTYGAGAYSCYAPSSSYNVVSNNTDCDDSAADVFPGNTQTNRHCTYSSPCAGFYNNSDNGGDHNCDSFVNKGLWQGPGGIDYPFSAPLPGFLYYMNASGSYIQVQADSGACGSLFAAGPNGSWYTYGAAPNGSWYTASDTPNAATVVFYGNAQVECK